MSRKQRIIISITGIVIVGLVLVGLTYGYFLTKITGNTNDKSVDVTTAYLALQYQDGENLIIENLMPGKTVGQKKFSVKNVGNGKVGNYVIVLENVINELERNDDLEYTLKCISDNDKNPCNGITDTFPKNNKVLISNSIDILTTHTYELTIYYKNPNEDQSIDMNKKIDGKIQIYDARNIVDINGIVNNSESGDYVELHSDVKISKIDNDSKYNIVGVLPGDHTLYIKDKNGNIKASKKISIDRGKEIDVDLDKIVITKDTSSINMDVNIKNGNLELNVDVIENPYKDNANSLNYNIINNSIINNNGTTLSKDSISIPGKEISKVNSVENTLKDLGTIKNNYVSVEHQDYYVTYADSFKYDENNKKFQLINLKSCKYSECYSNLIGKYTGTFRIWGFATSSNKVIDFNNLDTIYKFESVDAPDPDRINGVYYNISAYKAPTIDAERTISITADDYGDSYYFRGDIKDNYVNFAGMCWRIVRILGDGSTKLVLEDKNTTCNNEKYTGDYVYKDTQFGTSIETLDNGTKIYKNNILNYENGLLDTLKDFQDNKLSEYISYLNNENWCYDNRTYEDVNGTKK